MNIFKKARKQKKMTQQLAADTIDNFQSWISDVEKDKIQPSLFWAWQLAELYGVDFRAVGRYYGRAERVCESKNPREDKRVTRKKKKD